MLLFGKVHAVDRARDESIVLLKSFNWSLNEKDIKGALVQSPILGAAEALVLLKVVDLVVVVGKGERLTAEKAELRRA